VNSWDLECLSCGAHWMQICSCTKEQITEAENKFLRMQEQVNEMETMTLEELLRRIK